MSAGSERLPARLAKRINRWRFEGAVRGMRRTQPLARGDRNFAVLSMVQHRDVLAYLLAVKTFARLARPERIIVLADPTLDADDRSLIGAHVPGVEIREAVDYRRPALPVGGAWERLSAIAALSAETSVVQLDSDTVTYGEPSEVVEAACAGDTCLLRGDPDVEIMDLAAAAAVGRGMLARTQHIQTIAEARLTELAHADSYRYARGCAGFTGFGRGAISPERLESLSAEMRAIHGARWDEWGSEQVTSNLFAASAPGAFMLPHPRYCNGDETTEETVLAHYIGYIRFRTRAYELSARRVASALREAAS